MGSYSGLNLGPFSITESKNEFISYHSELFQAQDLVVSLHEETTPEEHYERPLRLVLERLELLGHTLERARCEFERPNPTLRTHLSPSTRYWKFFRESTSVN
jgi:hypothetical protein